MQPKGEPKVLLASLPWTTLTEPSLGLAILKAICRDAGIACQVRHLNIEMLRLVRPATYYALANVFGLNDFLFSFVLDPEVTSKQRRILREKAMHVASYGIVDLQKLGGLDGLIAELLTLRNQKIPMWLNQIADEFVASQATLFGLTCMFDQTIASLALAKLIRERAPERVIALGGYAIREPTGSALLKSFPWIDAVCAGEGENVIVPLAKASAGDFLDDVPGIIFRDEYGHIRENPGAPQARMDSVPTPDFDDFFYDIDRLAENDKVRIPIERLPLENSRGCWWGAKHHCTFCGIHDSDLRFREKSADVVLRDMDKLHERHGINAFRFSDYILPHRYHKTLLPVLSERGKPYRITSEMKANITAEKFRQLAEAGFEEVQPGIESFSTPVLRAMDKGVSAVRNVHTLLLAKRHHVLAHYNVLYGFPSDNAADYAEMAAKLPRLKHLDPPSTRLEVQITRYAPLQADPARFGLPEAAYEPSYEIIFSERYLTKNHISLGDTCYYFLRPFENSPSLNRLYRKIDELIDAWKTDRRERECSLWYEWTDNGLLVTDTRWVPIKKHLLSKDHAEILLACEEPVSVVDFATDPNNVEALQLLDALKLVFCDGGEVISLVLPKEIPPQTEEARGTPRVFNQSSSKVPA